MGGVGGTSSDRAPVELIVDERLRKRSFIVIAGDERVDAEECFRKREVPGAAKLIEDAAKARLEEVWCREGDPLSTSFAVKERCIAVRGGLEASREFPFPGEWSAEEFTAREEPRGVL